MAVQDNIDTAHTPLLGTVSSSAELSSVHAAYTTLLVTSGQHHVSADGPRRINSVAGVECGLDNQTVQMYRPRDTLQT